MFTLLSYFLGSIFLGAVVGYCLPRVGLFVGAGLLLVGAWAVGMCVYHECIMTKPHDTSAYGMAATLSCLTIVPMGLAALIAGALRK